MAVDFLGETNWIRQSFIDIATLRDAFSNTLYTVFNL